MGLPHSRALATLACTRRSVAQRAASRVSAAVPLASRPHAVSLRSCGAVTTRTLKRAGIRAVLPSRHVRAPSRACLRVLSVVQPWPHGVTALGGAAVSLSCIACTHLRALASHVAHIVAISITYRGLGDGPGAPVNAPDRVLPPWDRAAARPAARTPSVAPLSSRAAAMGPLAACDASCTGARRSAIAARPPRTPQHLPSSPLLSSHAPRFLPTEADGAGGRAAASGAGGVSGECRSRVSCSCASR